MSSILVTGAAGFIGSHLVDALLSRGESVVGFDNFDPYYPAAVKQSNLAQARQNSRFALVEGDLRDRASLERLFAEHDISRVAHLAAKAGVRPSIANPVAYVEHNLTGTTTLLEVAAVHSERLKQFVFASSSSVYGDTTDVPFREDAPTDQPASPYAATKKAGELICFTYHHLTGIPVTCLRFFTVYGPRQRPDLAIHKFARLILAGKPLPLYGDGSTSRDYTFVEDTIAGVIAALDRPQGYRIYNLGRGEPISLLDLVRHIETAFDCKAQIDWQPLQAGDVTITYADISRARADLGYDPQTSFAEGIQRFAAWLKEETPPG